MKWEEFANNGFILDEESYYDGWNDINFYEDYRCILFGNQIALTNIGNKLTDDEIFNVELKSSFPNLILIDNYERKKIK